MPSRATGMGVEPVASGDGRLPENGVADAAVVKPDGEIGCANANISDDPSCRIMEQVAVQAEREIAGFSHGRGPIFFESGRAGS